MSTGVSGLSPEIMGLGPIEAVKKALANAKMSIGDIDLYEINEAFAVQVLGSARELGMDLEKLNVSGGAIALGHPFGMTGARITATLLNNLATHDKTFGIETMCVGGGQGMAMVVERSPSFGAETAGRSPDHEISRFPRSLDAQARSIRARMSDGRSALMTRMTSHPSSRRSSERRMSLAYCASSVRWCSPSYSTAIVTSGHPMSR